MLTDAIAHCGKVGDYTTRHQLEQIVTSQEEHVDWIETQLETIEQMGLEQYLSEQMREESS